jgi:hypothetical protein
MIEDRILESFVPSANRGQPEAEPAAAVVVAAP